MKYATGLLGRCESQQIAFSDLIIWPDFLEHRTVDCANATRDQYKRDVGPNVDLAGR